VRSVHHNVSHTNFWSNLPVRNPCESAESSQHVSSEMPQDSSC